jgi:beta-N-acetylhexosaminidase
MTEGAYIFGVEGLALTPEECRFFQDVRPWGFILFARNVDNPEQLRGLTDALRDCVGWNVPILIDQEGGRVQRLRAPHWREYLPALDQIEASGHNVARGVYLRNLLIATELMDVGINVNCAPVADLIWPETHPIMRNRCYGSDVGTVVDLCRATAEGMLAAGVLPVLKHIPGYGRAVVDGHKDLPRVDVARAELERTDFAPFKALTDLPMGMTAHIVYPCIDEAPATTSAKAMAMIRNDIGYDNLIMTDDISMEALSGTVAERARASLDAGCDLVLHCNGKLEEMRAVADISGRQTSACAERCGRALAQRQSPTDIDIHALEAEFQALLTSG